MKKLTDRIRILAETKLAEEDDYGEVKAWLRKHGLPQGLVTVLAAIPEQQEGDGDFSLRLHAIGNKHYVALEKEEQLVAWLKLTVELFFRK